MNCAVARQLMDSYLEHRLSLFERQRFETHVASCRACSAEVRSRSSLDRAIRQTLSASVQDRSLPADRTTQMIRNGQRALHRSLWSRRLGVTIQVMAAAAALFLVVVGVFLWQAGIPIPSTIGPIPLPRVQQLVSSEIAPTSNLPVESLSFLDPQPIAFSSEAHSGLSLTRGESLVEPASLHPGEPFTITALLNSELPQALESVHIELDIQGPTGYYDFTLVVHGPFQAQSVSVLQVTPTALAAPCQDKYLIDPTDIFRLTGRYVVRVALSIPPEPAGH